jgi:hypothetical protein
MPCITGQHITIFEKFGTKTPTTHHNILEDLSLRQCHWCDKLNLVSTQQHNGELPLLQPCCRWNSSSSSAAVIRLEVGRALMEAVRGCTGVLQPPVPWPCWWWIDSAELLLVVPADPPTIPSGSWSSLSSFSPPTSGIEDPNYASKTA